MCVFCFQACRPCCLRHSFLLEQPCSQTTPSSSAFRDSDEVLVLRPFPLECLTWSLLLCSYLLRAALYRCASETSAGHSLFHFHSVLFLFYSPNACFVFIPQIVSVLFYFVFLSRATYSQGSNWLCTQKRPPASSSWVLGLQMYRNIHGFYSTILIVQLILCFTLILTFLLVVLMTVLWLSNFI